MMKKRIRARWSPLVGEKVNKEKYKRLKSCSAKKAAQSGDIAELFRIATKGPQEEEAVKNCKFNTQITFNLYKDGSVGEIKIIKKDGMFDRSTTVAIAQASTFPRPPEGFMNGKEKLPMMWDFYVDINPQRVR